MSMIYVPQRLTHFLRDIEDAALQIDEIKDSSDLQPDQRAAAVLVISDLNKLASKVKDLLDETSVVQLKVAVKVPQTDYALFDVDHALADLKMITAADVPVAKSAQRLKEMFDMATKASHDIAISVHRRDTAVATPEAVAAVAGVIPAAVPAEKSLAPAVAAKDADSAGRDGSCKP